MIILLNGCSLAGKSSISKALQIISEKPLLHLGVDTFIEVMPASYIGYGTKAAEGFHFTSTMVGGTPITQIETGCFGNDVIKSMHQVAKILVTSGLDLILDDGHMTADHLKHYIQVLWDLPVYFIGIHCDLPTLQEHELLRVDRAIGMARDQYTKVHTPPRFDDFENDTTHTSHFTCAKDILSFIDENPRPLSFNQLHNYFT